MPWQGGREENPCPYRIIIILTDGKFTSLVDTGKAWLMRAEEALSFDTDCTYDLL
jgi:hypothetical protein